MDDIRLPVTALYAGFLGLMLLPLSIKVTMLRVRTNIPLLDGGDKQLARAIRAQGNFIEYVPLALLLMAIVEINGAVGYVMHGFGLVLVASRILHAFSLVSASGATYHRVVGMGGTWGVIAVGGGLAMIQYIALN